jgi:hypothetical protein
MQVSKISTAAFLVFGAPIDFSTKIGIISFVVLKFRGMYGSYIENFE